MHSDKLRFLATDLLDDVEFELAKRTFVHLLGPGPNAVEAKQVTTSNQSVGEYFVEADIALGD